MLNNFVSMIWFPKSQISWTAQLETVGTRNLHIADDQTQCPAAVWSLNIMPQKFHAFLIIRSAEV